MKKQGIPVLLIITIMFAAFTLGYFVGYNRRSSPVTLSIPGSMQTVPAESTAPAEMEPAETNSQPEVSFPIDLNTAKAEEFMALPGIEEVLAQRIIAYREENGGFTCVEDILNVEGIGKKRFEEIVNLITIGG